MGSGAVAHSFHPDPKQRLSRHETPDISAVIGVSTMAGERANQRQSNELERDLTRLGQSCCARTGGPVKNFLTCDSRCDSGGSRMGEAPSFSRCRSRRCRCIGCRDILDAFQPALARLLYPSEGRSRVANDAGVQAKHAGFSSSPMRRPQLRSLVKT